VKRFVLNSFSDICLCNSTFSTYRHPNDRPNEPTQTTQQSWKTVPTGQHRPTHPASWNLKSVVIVQEDICPEKQSLPREKVTSSTGREAFGICHKDN